MWANHNERKGSIGGAGDNLDSHNGSPEIMSGGSGSGKEKNAKASARISLSGSKQGQRPQEPLASTDMKQVFTFGSKGFKSQANGRPKSSAGARPAGAILDELNGGNESLSDSEQSVSTLTVLDLPENVIETLFTFLPLSDIRNCALVCKHWCNVLSDENNEVWRSHCYKRMNRDIIHGELLSSCPTYKSKIRALFHAWNPQDCSRNVFVKPSGFTIHRNPVAQSTDGARGKIGFSRGRHAWEVIWEGPLGTVAVVGIATKQAEMRAQGYVALLGQDEHSWGWNLVENYLLHNGDSQGNYPLVNNAPRYQVGEKIRVILDCEDNTLSFEKNYEFLGVAFRGLPKQELFPAISAVYGNTEVSMVYLGPPLDG